jgi:hypothetical protein
MNAADFRRIALSLEGAEESSHMGATHIRLRTSFAAGGRGIAIQHASIPIISKDISDTTH